MLVKNVANNGLEDRVTIQHGGLRDEAVMARLGGPFELITATPPYFPPSAATDALDQQRAYARIEYRGGVEAYIATASRLLATDGWFVICGAAGADERVETAAGEHGIPGATCPNCKKPLLRLLSLTVRDPRLELDGLARSFVHLLFCWTCPLERGFIYALGEHGGCVVSA